jgi:GNAT superfamily N-acetyltransferase
MQAVVKMQFRRAHAEDALRVRAFLSRLSARTLQARYLSPIPSLSGEPAEREAQRLLDGDQRRHVLVMTDSLASIRGIGEFFVDDSGASAELALVVEDGFQNRGLGQLLYARLEQLARAFGIAQFTGHVGYGNMTVLGMLRNSGRPVRVDMEYGAVQFRLALAA